MSRDVQDIDADLALLVTRRIERREMVGKLQAEITNDTKAINELIAERADLNPSDLSGMITGA